MKSYSGGDDWGEVQSDSGGDGGGEELQWW